MTDVSGFLDGSLAFGEKMLALLDQGAFTASYKYAVVVGLLDACRERTSEDGRAPASITTSHLAEKVLALYWPQSVPYRGRREPRVLFQSRPRERGRPSQAEILQRIVAFRARTSDPTALVHWAKQAYPHGYHQLLEFIEWKLVEMPLPRLQRFGETADPFIYEIAWDEQVKRSQLRDPAFDRRIRFVGLAGENLLMLSGLLRPLLHREWARMVAELNGDTVDAADLERHLFGANRVALDAVRPGLSELQRERCFYCDARLSRSRPAVVDHFLPWARTGNDCLENLVVADADCNGSKRDFLAANDALARWRGRMATAGERLVRLGADVSWPLDSARTLSEARALYLRLREGARLWAGRNRFVGVDHPALRALLADAAALAEPPAHSRAGVHEAPAAGLATDPPHLLAVSEVVPFHNAVPVYDDLIVAAGRFTDEQGVQGLPGFSDEFEPEDFRWVALLDRTVTRDLFVARVMGESMNRVVPNGAWCLFRLHPKGTRRGKDVLVHCRGLTDPEHGAHFTFKRYWSDTEWLRDDEFRHRRIELRPVSFDPSFAPIVLENVAHDQFAVVAELVDVLD